MKQFSQFFTIIIIAFLFLSEKSFAQNNEQPLLITSFYKVEQIDMDKINQMTDSVFVPILNGLVDEGFISTWGQFNHAWGDEWNFNLWFVAKDMASVEKFYDEYIKRAEERHPGSISEINKYFKAHKDNIYTIRNQYPMPTK